MHMSRLTRSITTALTLTITTAAVAVGAVLAQMPDTTRPVDTPVQAASAQEISPVRGCWFEKAASLETAELVCGDLTVAPAEGAADWYQLRDGEVPDVVWQYALTHGAPSDPSDGCECLYVPVGTAFGPESQLWVATYEGMEPVSWT